MFVTKTREIGTKYPAAVTIGRPQLLDYTLSDASSWKRPSQPRSLARLTPCSDGYLFRHSFIDDEYAVEELDAAR